MAVFHATSIQRHFVESESIDSAVVGIEHRLIDNKHLAGLTGSNDAFGAPVPFSFGVTVHAGGLYVYFDLQSVRTEHIKVL